MISYHLFSSIERHSYFWYTHKTGTIKVKDGGTGIVTLRKEVAVSNNVSVSLEEHLYNEIFPDIESLDGEPMKTILDFLIGRDEIRDLKYPNPKTLHTLLLTYEQYKEVAKPLYPEVFEADSFTKVIVKADLSRTGSV